MGLYGIQFSQFNVGGALQPADIVVGLRNNLNTQFTYAPYLFGWNIVSADTTMIGGYGYIVAGSGTIHLTLPTTIAAGTIIRVTGNNTAQWKIIQGAGQYILFGELSTTPGATGYLQSTYGTDSIELLCVNVNIGFVMLSSIGNITVN